MHRKLISSLNLTPPALRDISLRVAAVNGVNLGQGVCYLPAPPAVLEAARAEISAGKNRYAPPQGRPELRAALSAKLGRYNRIPTAPENVLVTAGATGAFEVVCRAFLEPGDEVVSFRPFYPYHHNPLRVQGALVRYVDLNPPDWSFSEKELTAAFNPRTKFILICTPGNPTGKVFSRSELELVARLCRRYDAACVTDETYEYMTYEAEHLSPAALPELFDRTITMGSYSKTFAVTGWRIGYLAAPERTVEALKTLSDQIYVCAPTPLQLAVARGITELPEDYYLQLRRDYTRKRELLLSALNSAGLHAAAPAGAYYMLAHTAERFPGLTSEEAADRLITVCGVGAVPASDFLGAEVKGDPARSNFLRFCYAVEDRYLEDAAERLQRLS